MGVKEETETGDLKFNIQKTKIMTSTAITSQQIDEEAVEMKSYEKLRQCIKKQKHHFSNIVLSSQSYDFSISHVWM